MTLTESARMLKNREHRVRRSAEKQGMKLTKARLYGQLAGCVDPYYVYDHKSNTLLTPREGSTLNEVEEFLVDSWQGYLAEEYSREV